MYFLKAGLASLLLTSSLVSSAPQKAFNGLSKRAFNDGLSFYYPSANSHQVSNFAAAPSQPPTTANDFAAIAKNYVVQAMGLSSSDNIKITHSSFDSNGNTLIHCKPLVNGIPVANAAANINLRPDGSLVSFHESWAHPSLQNLDASTTPSTTPLDALKSFADAKGFKFDPSKTTVSADAIKNVDFATGDVKFTTSFYRTANSLVKCFDLSIPAGASHFNAFVDQSTGKVVGVTDWASSSMFHSKEMLSRKKLKKLTKRNQKSSPSMELVKRKMSRHLLKRKNTNFVYTAAQFPSTDASVSFAEIKNPQDLSVSPNGWHNDGTGNKDTTVGNNVIAQVDGGNPIATQNGIATQGLDAAPVGAEDKQVVDSANEVTKIGRPTGKDFQFNFKFDDQNQLPPQYADASVTNMFFVANTVHDVTYHFGFDENSGNFQNDNFGKGGQGNDAVVAVAQDSQGTDNANFQTPPDGQSGIMRMFIFTSAAVGRDGALDNQVVSHEMMHGVSGRLTGGAADGNCLQTLESGGLGEGWSDFNAIFLTTPSTANRNQDVAIGKYAVNNAQGVRRQPYSTSLTTNKLKFSDLNNADNQEVHNIGEIWCSMLFESFWNMNDKLGISDNFSDNKSGKGNTEFFQLVMDGLKLQPCNPTFIQARDAILLADKNKNKGANKCDILSGFAKRGLGLKASDKGQFVDDFTLPADCAKAKGN